MFHLQTADKSTQTGLFPSAPSLLNPPSISPFFTETYKYPPRSDYRFKLLESAIKDRFRIKWGAYLTEHIIQKVLYVIQRKYHKDYLSRADLNWIIEGVIERTGMKFKMEQVDVPEGEGTVLVVVDWLVGHLV